MVVESKRVGYDVIVNSINDNGTLPQVAGACSRFGKAVLQAKFHSRRLSSILNQIA